VEAQRQFKGICKSRNVYSYRQKPAFIAEDTLMFILIFVYEILMSLVAPLSALHY
jgi:hypothetical protein